jgi:MFS family permease
MFAAWGRKKGFLMGVLFGIAGVGVGTIAVFQQSNPLLLVAYLLFGAATGMGMYLRFAAVEVLAAPVFRERAVSWVLAGGCLAAFAGPESAQATKGLMVDDRETQAHLEYVGVFWVAGLFFLTQAVFVSLCHFDAAETVTTTMTSPTFTFPKEEPVESAKSIHVEAEQVREVDAAASTLHIKSTTSAALQEVRSVLTKKSFLIPFLVATLSWAIMAMPMSIFRVAMKELGYTERQSLTVIELHFLAMYAPGFWTGKLTAWKGPRCTSMGAVGILLAATVVNILSQPNHDSIATWCIGLILLGIGWNVGFSSATIWVTSSYKDLPHLKPKIQAANEAGVFLGSGAQIFCTGYIYEAGGSGLDGWRTLNYAILGLVGLLGVVLAASSTDNVTTKNSNDDDNYQPTKASLETPNLEITGN